jgi:pSer/pThr/pTyr-binding forkhead associated (FHA) protein
MNVKLIVTKGPTRTRTIQLRSCETLVGRQRGCDLRIPSPEVSRRHCILHFDQGKLTVEDLRSSNGTFLNEKRVTGKRLVHPGDQLQIGPLTFKIQFPAPSASRDSEPGSKLADEKPATEPEPFIELADDKSAADDTPIPLMDEASSKESADVVFDDAETMNLPEGEEFRDLLRKMDK